MSYFKSKNALNYSALQSSQLDLRGPDYKGREGRKGGREGQGIGKKRAEGTCF